MLITLDGLVKKYDMKIVGALHIGAHFGEEVNLLSMQIKQTFNSGHMLLEIKTAMLRCSSVIMMECVVLF